MLRGGGRGILLLAGLGSVVVEAAALLPGGDPGADGAPPGPPVLSQHTARATLRGDTVPSMRFAVRDVSVFDGVDVRTGMTVLVEGGRISAVGGQVTVRCEVPVLDGRGLVLLPAPVWLEEGSDFVRVPEGVPPFADEADTETGAEAGFDGDDGEDPAAAPLLAGVRDAHGKGVLAVVRTASLAGLERAVAAGADGVLHSWNRAPLPRGLAERMAAAGMFLVPLAEGGDPPDTGDRAPDEALALGELPGMGVAVVAWLDPRGPARPGAELQDGLRILVELGLDPLDALRAATSLPARLTALGRGGRIVPGARADLVLVEGDARSVPGALREIVGSWIGGLPVEGGRRGESAHPPDREGCGR